MAIRIEITQEWVSVGIPARVRIYEGDRLIAEVTGKIGYQVGADGGIYHAVVLEQSSPVPTAA
jgi:hypothetical protein